MANTNSVPNTFVAFKRLVGVQVTAMLRSSGLVKGKTSDTAVFSLVIRILTNAGYLLAMSIIAGLLGFFIATMMPDFLPAILTLYTFIIAFGIGFSKSASALFGSQDYELTQSLPVSTKVVVFSKVFSTYIILVVCNIFIVLPMCLPLLGVIKCGAIFWLSVVAAILFSQCVPMALALLVGFLLSLFVRRFKFSGIVSILAGVIVVVAIFGLSIALNSGNITFQALFGALGVVRDVLVVYPLAAWLEVALLQNSAAGLLLFVASSAIVLFVAIAVLARCYMSANSAVAKSYHNKKLNIEETELKSNKPLKALLAKEFKVLFNSQDLAINVLFADIIMIVVAVAIGVFGLATVTNLVLGGKYTADELETMAGVFRQVIPWFFMIFLMGKSTCYYGISLEGRTAWINSTLPVPSKTILFSKILLNLIDTVVITIFCAIFLVVTDSIEVFEAFQIIVVCPSFFFAVSAAGLYFDAKKPFFDWIKPKELTNKPGLAIISLVSLALIAVCAFVAVISAITLGGAGAFVVSLVLSAVALFVGKLFLDKASCIPFYC
ncbi:MAG: hypothetical protein Q3982_02100 [Phoenicibacter congonensis]|uniref:ABC-2 type transport system permease protein n=1 Tax=Phoenicibacter congonensis TaxID=1944646 RepID=A0AA43UAW8_9ACTN|nr:hypothetical protein [Phoenicibacter congonensis]